MGIGTIRRHRHCGGNAARRLSAIEFIKPLNGRRHLFRRTLPLHRHRPEQHMARESIRQPVQNIANHRAGGGGNNTNGFRQKRNRLFAFCVEQAFGLQRFFARLQHRHQRADARRFHCFDDELVFRAARIGGELAGGNHLHPRFGLVLEAAHRAFPAHCVEQRFVVLQTQIAMPRRMVHTGFADFPAHPHIAERLLDHTLELARDLANRIFRTVMLQGHAVGFTEDT